MSTVGRIGPDHFRYYEEIGPGGVTIRCQRFVVIGETQHCYYVVKEGLIGLGSEFLKTHRKRVLKVSGKRHCYPDKKSAMESYRARKRWQISHAKVALDRAEAGMAAAEELLNAGLAEMPNQHHCEGGEYIRSLNWLDY